MTETYEMCKTLIDEIINSIDTDVEKTIVKKQTRKHYKDIISSLTFVLLLTIL